MIISLRGHGRPWTSSSPPSPSPQASTPPLLRPHEPSKHPCPPTHQKPLRESRSGSTTWLATGDRYHESCVSANHLCRAQENLHMGSLLSSSVHSAAGPSSNTAASSSWVAWLAWVSWAIATGSLARAHYSCTLARCSEMRGKPD